MAKQTNYMNLQPSQSNGMAERQASDKKNWDKMLQQAALVSKMTEKQALGYGLGRLLSSIWNEHLARRHDPHEQERRRMAKLQKQAEDLQSKNGQLKAGMDGLQQQNATPWRGGLSYADGAGNVYGVTPTADPNEGIVAQLASQMSAPQAEAAAPATEQMAQLLGEGFQGYDGRDPAARYFDDLTQQYADQYARAVGVPAQGPEYQFSVEDYLNFGR